MSQVVVNLAPNGDISIGTSEGMPDMFALGVLELAAHVMKRKVLAPRPAGRIEVPKLEVVGSIPEGN